MTATKSSMGVVTLHHYLDYAEKGAAAFKACNSKQSELPPVEAQVAAEIKKMGYDIRPQVGLSSYKVDLGVVDPTNPQNYLIGVECDGEGYSASLSARDRDRLHEQVLNQLGWRIYRIWSPSWVLNKESEVIRLGQAIKQASSKTLESQVKGPLTNLHLGQGETDERKAPSIKKISFDSVENIGVPYRVCKLTANYPHLITVGLQRYPYYSERKNEFHYRVNRPMQVQLFERIVQNEGPIHLNIARQRLLDAWGVKRSGRNIDIAIDEVLYQLKRDGKITQRGDFLWSPGLSNTAVRRPIAGIRNGKKN